MPRKKRGEEARKQSKEGLNAVDRMFERNALFEEACRRKNFDVVAIAEELGISPQAVGQFLDRRGITSSHLAVFQAADRSLARRLLNLREEAFRVVREVLLEGSETCRLKAAEITLNYVDRLSEKVELSAMACDIIDHVPAGDS